MAPRPRCNFRHSSWTWNVKQEETALSVNDWFYILHCSPRIKHTPSTPSCTFLQCTFDILSHRFYQVRAGVKVSPRVPHRVIVTTQDNAGTVKWRLLTFGFSFVTLCGYFASVFNPFSFLCGGLCNNNDNLSWFKANILFYWFQPSGKISQETFMTPVCVWITITVLFIIVFEVCVWKQLFLHSVPC